MEKGTRETRYWWIRSSLPATSLLVGALAALPVLADGGASPAPTASHWAPTARSGLATALPDFDPLYVKVLEARRVEVEQGDQLATRVLAALGAHFTTEQASTVPTTWLFPSSEETAAFQKKLEADEISPGMAIQRGAARSLRAAQAEARSIGKSITGRGSDAASRSFLETQRLWLSRVRPGLEHWVARHRLSREDADKVLAMGLRAQVAEILALEERGMYFSPGWNKSILYSVAAPGTSQHLSLLAFDVAEHGDPEVRAILARYGWFQTVYSDLPHFTYIGVDEKQLKKLGLRPEQGFGRVFHVVAGPVTRGIEQLFAASEDCAF